METTQHDSEVLVPDQVIDDRFHSLFINERESVRGQDVPALTRRQKFAATLLLVVLTIAALGVASVVAVGAIIVASVLFVVGLVARLAVAISGKASR